MPEYRMGRISEEIRKTVDRIIRESLKDPRISGTFCITRADATRDLRHAKIHVSLLESENLDALVQALQSASGFIRRELGQRMNLRFIPELKFLADRNMEHGVRISRILSSLSESGASGSGAQHEDPAE